MNRTTPNIAVIIQARMNSSRLPGKVLMNIAGEPMLGWLVKRVTRSVLAQNFVVATSNRIEDDLISRFCEDNDINCYRGSEANVLQRMIEAAQFYDADVIVRLTADNPFVGADLVDLVLSKFLCLYPNIDYVSNTDEGGFPFGLFVEAVKTSSLLNINELDPSADQIEHVTLSFRQNATTYLTHQIKSNFCFADVMLTIDTKSDFDRLEPVFTSLVLKDPFFNYSDIAEIYDAVS